jgi:predicted GNAT superfamily acetyltransferase
MNEMQQAEELQRLVWDDTTTVIYTHMLLSLARNGGVVHGAFDGDQLIGLLISFLGLESLEAERPAMANLKLVSQRMAVRPEYRDSGIGHDLKLAQRQFAIRQGIRLVTWTYDPLISRNAHLNIRKLGAIVREYLRDYYGTDTGPLSTLGSSDRLFVEWWVTNNRVEQRVDHKRPGLTLDQYLSGGISILNPAEPALRGYLRPAERWLRPSGSLALVEIPDNIYDIRDDDPDLAIAWRLHVRDVFEGLLGPGNYVITDLVRGIHEEHTRTFYALSRGDAVLSRLIGN